MIEILSQRYWRGLSIVAKVSPLRHRARWSAPPAARNWNVPTEKIDQSASVDRHYVVVDERLVALVRCRYSAANTLRSPYGREPATSTNMLLMANRAATDPMSDLVRRLLDGVNRGLRMAHRWEDSA